MAPVGAGTLPGRPSLQCAGAARWVGQEMELARLYAFSLHHEPLFTHTYVATLRWDEYSEYLNVRRHLNIFCIIITILYV